jgi:hypothetical protein
MSERPPPLWPAVWQRLTMSLTGPLAFVLLPITLSVRGYAEQVFCE